MREIKIPEMIETLLVKTDMTQKELANVIGVTDNTISCWCTGTRTPSLSQLISLSDIFCVSLDYLAFGTGETSKLKRCKNCGRMFYPMRTDAEYCRSSSPQEPRLSCRDYNSKRACYERMKKDELAVLSRNILSAKGMMAKRNPHKKSDYDNYRKERLVWKKKYETGEISPEEYKSWLIIQKGGT